MRLLPICLLLGSVSTAAIAQDQPNTILVLDGSGSMWGQIDGVAKITIAQEVVSGLLEDFPADQGLGLTVYGHRERGNCTDIETIVAPAPGTVSDIVSAVNGIKPLGKTPMTDAVIAAAEALRYTEDSATVILVSDGVETCNPDPCAAARLLEEAGIDFTTHVVGFDVSDPEALAQMQCIADETGGQFLTASNADELDLAMASMVMEPAPEPEPALVTVTFTAVLGDEKALIDTPVLWDITGNDGAVITAVQGNPYVHELPEGAYTATAYSVASERSGSAQFVAIGGGDAAVEIMFEEILPTARIIAPATALAGSTIQVGWDGPGGDRDYVGIGELDAEGAAQWENFFYMRDGNPQDLLMPTRPGEYSIAYFLGETRTKIGEAAITLEEVFATIDIPAEAIVGDDITVDWTGPGYQNDYIGVGAIGADGAAQWQNFFYTRDAGDNVLRMPTEPGTYVVSYFLGQDRRILTSTEITLKEVGATLSHAATAEAGSTISVDWTGPDYQNDYIGIGAIGADGSAQWQSFQYTRDGTPATLVMPTEPGDYLIQYFIGQDRTILATSEITATEVGATVSGPAEAEAGSTISVDWTGPSYQSDYIGIGAVGANGSEKWQSFHYTRDGNPALLVVPTEPGDYLIQYFLGQDRSVLASVPLTATEVSASVSPPAEAIAGSTITVDWTGPDYNGDYIGIGAVNASGSAQWESFHYTENGAPATLLVPIEAGDYLVQYFVGQDRSVLASKTITVSELKVSVTAPAEAVAGSTIDISYDGPNYEGDYIGIGAVGASGSAQWETFVYTRDGNPLPLLVPITAGDYEISYFSGQDRSRLFTAPMTVTRFDTQLVAPDTAATGSEFVVGWDGPDYQGDYIGIGAVDATGSARWEAFAYTESGNPVTVTLPETAGDYLIQYFTGQGRISAGSRALTIE